MTTKRSREQAENEDKACCATVTTTIARPESGDFQPKKVKLCPTGQNAEQSLTKTPETTNQGKGGFEIVGIQSENPATKIYSMEIYYAMTEKRSPCMQVPPNHVLVPFPTSYRCPIPLAAEIVRDPSIVSVIPTRRKTNEDERVKAMRARLPLFLEKEKKGLVILDFDKCIIASTKDAVTEGQAPVMRKGLIELIKACSGMNVDVGFYSTAGSTTVNNYADHVEQCVGIKLDIRISNAMVTKYAIGKGNKGVDFPIKDLSTIIGDDATMSRTVFVDDLLINLVLQPDNSFLAPEFDGDLDKPDTFLFDLTTHLKEMFATEGDIREMIKAKNGLGRLMQNLKSF